MKIIEKNNIIIKIALILSSLNPKNPNSDKKKDFF